MTTSTRAVGVALIVDLVISAAKVTAFVLTGSTAIMAEVLHSAKDLQVAWRALDGPEALERLLIEFGGEVTDAVGDEVDRIEAELGEAVPEARHVDLEPD